MQLKAPTGMKEYNRYGRIHKLLPKSDDIFYLIVSLRSNIPQHNKETKGLQKDQQ
jgi:hypothetical protein